jgi:hypothetical protein
MGRDTSGRDVSTYVCDKEELIHCCKVYAGKEGRFGSLDDALVVVPDQADCISYSLLVKELCDYANTCTASEFSTHCNALLSDLAGIGNDEEARAEGISADSAGDDQHDLTANDAPKPSVFSAPSAYRYSVVEQAFRERVVKEFADLCSDTLPPEGPSATLPDGMPYKVKLNFNSAASAPYPRPRPPPRPRPQAPPRGTCLRQELACLADFLRLFPTSNLRSLVFKLASLTSEMEWRR